MIIVLGSINVDLIVRVHAFPRPGETIQGDDLVVMPGGKGANQALVARRMNSTVALIGSIGKDSFAKVALASLIGAGVDVTNVAVVDRPTGTAVISVNRSGENQIIVSPGANSQTTAATLSGLKTAQGDVFLVQREICDEVTIAGLRWAGSRKLHRILNAAPASELSAELLSACDTLIVNEYEAAAIAAALGLRSDPQLFAQDVACRFQNRAVVTLGSNGVVGHDGTADYRVEGFPAEVVDTTGAGDAFVGAMAVAISENIEFSDCLKYGAAAGSVACERFGAQASAPTRNQVEALLGLRPTA
ncbi:MAG TPA: ribokinase [Nitrobacter sp.]|jgi:ribokinase|nr:ribokinase [Nitrobacter sp.]